MIDKIQTQIYNVGTPSSDFSEGHLEGLVYCIKLAKEEKESHEEQVKAIIDIHQQELRQIKKELKEKLWDLFDLEELYKSDQKPFLEILEKAFTKEDDEKLKGVAYSDE